MTQPKKPSIDLKRIIEIISTGGAIIAAILSLAAFLFDTKSISNFLPSGGTNSNASIDAQQLQTINAEISLIKQEQANLTSKIDSLSQVTTVTALGSELVDVKNSVYSINTRLTNIEDLIVQDPQKALEIPLLRKDLDTLTATENIQIESLRQEVERSYNLILVTIVALAVAVLAPALSNIFKRGKDAKESG